MGAAGKIKLIFVGLSIALGATLQAVTLEGVAKEWAPVLYKDFDHGLTQSETGFNPVDHPLNLFFDGNKDLRDNAINAFILDRENIRKSMQNPTVYYSVIESATHYYITYIIYHAIDFKIFGHAHDTENIWTIVKKGTSPYGSLVAQITNVHGYPMVYAPDTNLESEWRTKVNFPTQMRLFPFIDSYSLSHREGAPEYIKRAHSLSFQAFISSRSHAIYKWSKEAWKKGQGSGGVYLPENCLECLQQQGSTVKDQIFTYRLENWDSTVSSLFKPVAGRYLSYLPAGYEELIPKANLFHTTSFKTPHRLADPIGMHVWFSGTHEGISPNYLYNPYIKKSPSFWASWELSRKKRSAN